MPWAQTNHMCGLDKALGPPACAWILHLQFVLYVKDQRANGAWARSKQLCQPLELKRDLEFIDINFSLYRRSGSLAQSGGTKALPKVRFVSLLRVTTNTRKTHKATKLSKGCPPPHYTLVRLCPSALDAGSVPGALFIPEECLVGPCGGVWVKCEEGPFDWWQHQTMERVLSSFLWKVFGQVSMSQWSECRSWKAL